MIVLFWDIDGTLITTGKAGVPAWEQAVQETTGQPFDLSSIRIAGMTDYQIAVRTLELLGLEPLPDRISALVSRYAELLNRTLPQRKGRVFTNVREILESLRGRNDVRSYLLTGNTREGAEAKLRYYGLWEYFPDGAFAEDVGERASIAARGMELARRAGPLDEDRLFVIGDTPHDIHAGHAITARTIAVATGGYSLAELEEHRPWRLYEELPAPEEFERVLRGG